MNLLKTFALLALVSIPLTGCAIRPAVKTNYDLSPERQLSFVFPNASGEVKQGNAWQSLKVQSFENVDSHWTNKDVLRWRIGTDSCSVERYSAFLLSPNREVARHIIAYDCTIRSESPDSKSAVFTFKKQRTTQEYTRLGEPANKIQFSIDDVIKMLMVAELPVQMEFDSEYNTESTYANFVRLTRRESLSGQKDAVTGKIFKDRFYARVVDKEVPFSIETYPYRNGSKAIVYATIHGVSSGDVVDFSQTYEALYQAILKIIRS